MRFERIVRWLRIFVAAFSLAAMTALFVFPAAWVVRWFGWLPSVQLVPAVMAGSLAVVTALAVSVAFFGRLYCSVLCPLGIAQDVVRACFSWTRRLAASKKEVSIPCSDAASCRVHGVRWSGIARLAILALFVVGASVGFTGLIAPYGIFGRFLSVCVRRVGEPGVLVTTWAAGLFAFVLAMTFVRARWWCNQACPVGMFLGLFSRFARFRVRIDGKKCVKCGLCAKACDKGALTVGDGKEINVDSARCVTCFDCVGICKKGALRWH